ncbi:hypothetical protein D3C81_1978570 [compost metagenome]
MEHNFSPCRWQIGLDVIEHDLDSTDAMDRDDLVPRFRATLQDMLKDSLLQVD